MMAGWCRSVTYHHLTIGPAQLGAAAGDLHLDPDCVIYYGTGPLPGPGSQHSQTFYPIGVYWSTVWARA